MDFNTTSVGTAVPLTRMTLTSSGNLGLGTSAPGEVVEIARNGEAVVTIESFGTDAAAGVALRAAQGTQAAPTAVQAGDALGYFVTGGWDGGGFADAESRNDRVRGGELDADDSRGRSGVLHDAVGFPRTQPTCRKW